MSVERMEMMNVIGYMDDLDNVSAEIVKSGCVHIVNALNEIARNNFTVITPEQDTNALVNLSFIRQYSSQVESSGIDEKINELMDVFGIKRSVKQSYINGSVDYNDMFRNIESIYGEVTEFNKKLKDINEEIERIKEIQADMEHIQNVNINVDILRNLKFFNFKIGRLSRENFNKLQDNIENISAIIYGIRSIPGCEVFISFSPKVLEEEVDRIFKSLNYEEINIPVELEGTPKDIVTKLVKRIEEKEKELEDINKKIQGLKEKYGSFIDECYSKFKLYQKTQIIKNEVACTDQYFYMAGWVPESEKENLQKRLAGFGEKLVFTFKPQFEVSSTVTPPSKLKNNRLVRPFESVVRMYGIPSYNETDPTFFVAISYMLMFGCMFGDVGQGLVFVIAGILLSRKNRGSNLGGVLSRMGISSMIFGVLYGSVFGNEEIIPALLIKPFENINVMLIAGIVLGVLLTTVSFIYSLINAVKRKNLENGVFGNNGLVGLIFYWTILLTALSIFKGSATIVPMPVIIIILCILLGLMVFKQPLANLIIGKKPLYDEGPGDYYIESGFGIIETLLSMLSNTISFIRVGAFALNHVGLFLAFTTIGQMLNSAGGNIIMLIIGNIVIIGLEGLIVFIQALRLEYYELFSKYYEGEGIEYSPVRLRINSNI